MASSIKISEIFGPTIQGEGVLIGKPTLFVRTAGCDYRCHWCDTPYAVDSEYRHDWLDQDTQSIFEQLQEKSGKKPMLVTLSGGNPAIQNLGPLITLGQKYGYEFALETQGSIVASWFKDLNFLTLSPKPPSSNMDTDWHIFDECLKTAGDVPTITLKIVIFDEQDYLYAKATHAKYPHLPLYLQIGNHKITGKVDHEGLNNRFNWLIERVNSDQWYAPYIMPQLHVTLWGNQRGV